MVKVGAAAYCQLEVSWAHLAGLPRGGLIELLRGTAAFGGFIGTTPIGLIELTVFITNAAEARATLNAGNATAADALEATAIAAKRGLRFADWSPLGEFARELGMTAGDVLFIHVRLPPAAGGGECSPRTAASCCAHVVTARGHRGCRWQPHQRQLHCAQLASLPPMPAGDEAAGSAAAAGGAAASHGGLAAASHGEQADCTASPEAVRSCQCRFEPALRGISTPPRLVCHRLQEVLRRCVTCPPVAVLTPCPASAPAWATSCKTFMPRLPRCVQCAGACVRVECVC